MGREESRKRPKSEKVSFLPRFRLEKCHFRAIFGWKSVSFCRKSVVKVSKAVYNKRIQRGDNSCLTEKSNAKYRNI